MSRPWPMTPGNWERGGEARYRLWFRREVVFRFWIDWEQRAVWHSMTVESIPKKKDEVAA